MNESIISQVYGVLNKYDKCYSKNGIMDNLKAWEKGKNPLINLLRKHPNWNENALAVIFDVTQSREIDRYTVNSYTSNVGQLSTDLNIPENDRINLYSALNIATGSYTKLLPTEQAAADIKQYSGISCSKGQKTSRIINKICQRYGLDKHPEYNSRFAQLADSLNPIQVKRTALLSVHPNDYLEMSNEKNSWSSCHCIRKGEYHAGTLSYMNDGVSMIFYTVDEDVCEIYYSEPKRTRQVFCYSDGILLQSRLYPQTDDEEARNIYRDIVQRTIAICLDVPNLWTLKLSQQDVDSYCETHEDALQYTDYTHMCYKANVSLLKPVYIDDNNRIVVGNTAYCLDCSCVISSHDTLYCDNCNQDIVYITCSDCGEQIPEDDAHDIDGEYYCEGCCSYCGECGTYTRDEMTSVHNRWGNLVSVCEACCNVHYYCEDCGEYYHFEQGQELDDGFHCNNCLDGKYLRCDECGEYVLYDDAVEINGEFYCESCTEYIEGEVEENADCLVAV